MSQLDLANITVPERWEGLLANCCPLHIRYQPGEMITQSGSFVAGLQLIASGAVSERIATRWGGGPTQISGAGDLLGLEVLIGNPESYSRTRCRAITAVGLVFFAREHIDLILQEDGNLMRALLEYAAARLIRNQDALRCAGNVERTLLHLLMRLAQTCGQPVASGDIVLPKEISSRQLTSMVNISGRQLRKTFERIPSLRISEGCFTFNLDQLSNIVEGCAMS